MLEPMVDGKLQGTGQTVCYSPFDADNFVWRSDEKFFCSTEIRLRKV